MKIPHAVLPKLRGLTVVAFLALCLLIFSFLWLQAGGKIPGVSKAGYQVTVPVEDMDNLVFQSDVRVAGVEVGQIEEIEVRGRTGMVTLELDGDVAPLHEGATVKVRNKTMIEETYLEIVDGDGKAYANGDVLPAEAVEGSVQLNDVLSSLDDETRADLTKLVRSTGRATTGRKEDVDAVLAGLGDLGGSAGAMTALADQSKDLREMVRSATRVLDAMDTQQGRIVDMVHHAQTLTAVTSDQRGDVEEVVRELSPLIERTKVASHSLDELSNPLGRVSENLRGAAPDLDAALVELPATTRDLRGALPALDTALTRAPATLTRLSPFQRAADPLWDTLKINLADVNPMLEYMSPYGRDLASYWSNFIHFGGSHDQNGPIARVKPVFSANSLNLPLKTKPTTYFNPYPAPGSHLDPQEFTGEYPRVEEDPIP